MHTFTKVFLAVVAVLLIIFGAWYGINSYLFDHPDIGISFYVSDTEAENGVNVFTLPVLSFEPSTAWGVSEEWDNRYFEIQDVIGEMISVVKDHPDEGDWFYDSSVEIKDGKTVFTVFGWYTDGGERVDVKEEYTLDYVVTNDIDEH